MQKVHIFLSRKFNISIKFNEKYTITNKVPAAFMYNTKFPITFAFGNSSSSFLDAAEKIIGVYLAFCKDLLDFSSMKYDYGKMVKQILMQAIQLFLTHFSVIINN